METHTQWRQRIAVEALLEFIAPLADIAEGFRWDAEQTRKRGLHLLAADLFRFAKSVREIERRARWALHEFSKMAEENAARAEGGSVTFADGVTAFIRGVRLTVKEG